MATIKVKHAPKTDDTIRLYVEIEASGKELAANKEGVMLAVLREVGTALERGGKS